MPRRPASLLVTCLTLGAATPSAQASGPGPMDFRPQFELTLNATVAEASAFGGLELHGSASIFGLGFAVAAGWERAALMSGSPDGGYALLQVQINPLVWAPDRYFAQFNPYIAVGGLLGGLDPGVFRAGLAASVGFDVMLAPANDFELYPALTFEFRGVAPGTPDEAAQWYLVVGVGPRLAR